MSSWRYFAVCIPSSLVTIVMFSRRKVERRGCGNDAVEPEAGVLELTWWNEEMRFDRRILARLVVYASLSFSDWVGPL